MATFKRNLFVKVFGNLSLRTLLILLFVVQIFATVGLTGYLSFTGAQKAVNDLATQLQNEVSGRIQSHLKSYLEVPHMINQSHVNAANLGILDLQNASLLGKYFYQQLQAFKSVSTIYYGNEQGGIVVGRRKEDNTFTIEETEHFVANDFSIYNVDAQGNRAKLLRIAPYFDTRTRPWYEKAKKEGKAIWSEIFSIYARQDLGIAASLPVYNQSGELQGVMATQLVVSQVNQFLQGLKIGRTGKTFIMERSGLMVASSTDEKPFTVTQEGGKAMRLQASESRVPLIRATTEHLIERFGDLSQISTNQLFTFNLNNQRQYLNITPLQDDRGLDWLIVVVVPEADFMERIHENNRHTFLLFLAALTFAILIGIVTSRWIIKPVLGLTEAAIKLAGGEWNNPLPVQRADELGVLADSFNSMVKQLKESFAKLETKNEEIRKLNAELEQRVIERTAALNAKVEELVQTRNELLQSEKMASLGRLVAGFAHEINTPIGVAVGAASSLQEASTQVSRMLEQDEVDEEELLSALDSVGQAADLTLSNLRRAVRLVSSFKRTAIDQSTETYRLFNVLETIEDVNNSLHNKFKHTNIAIHITCAETLSLYGLPGMLDQILTNFMMNSLFHGFNNGELSGEIRIKVELIKDRLHLSYIDTGKGMAEEVAQKVFEPFFTTRRGHGGTGLGMYICYNLVTTQLHGSITCKSSPGKGVVFEVSYPVQVSAPAHDTQHHELLH